MKTIQEYNDYKEILFNQLTTMRSKSGLFRASTSEDYKATWWRDNCFINLCYLENDTEKYVQTVQTMLDVLKKLERKYTKLSAFIREPNDRSTYRFLHAKIDIDNEDEIPNLSWNHNQSDNPSLILLNIIKGFEAELPIIRDDSDRGVIQLLVDYTVAVGYKENCSSWEEENAVRLSSTALILKALREIRKYGFYVPEHIISEGETIYESLFPFEHMNKKVDLMLLYLPYFNICDDVESKYIVKSVEKTLLRDGGVCRYINDEYYKSNITGESSPWSFGLSYLSIIYYNLGYIDIAKMYCDDIMDRYPDGRIPELLVDGVANKNTPLAWCLSMQIQAIDKILKH